MIVIINGTKQPVILHWRLDHEKSRRDLVRPFQLGAGKQATLPDEWGLDEHVKFIDHHVKHYGMKKITELDAINAHDGIFYFERQAHQRQIIEAVEARDKKRDAEALDIMESTAVAFDHQMRHLAPDPLQPIGAQQTSMKVTTEIDPGDPEPEKVVNREIAPKPGRARRK